jgi:hypothetical protein
MRRASSFAVLVCWLVLAGFEAPATEGQITRNPAERVRLAAIVEIDVSRLKREFAIGRHRLATGQDDPDAGDDE